MKAEKTRMLVNFYKSELEDNLTTCNSKEYEIKLCIDSLEELKEMERLAEIGAAFENDPCLILARYDVYHQLKPKNMTIYDVVKEYREKIK